MRDQDFALQELLGVGQDSLPAFAGAGEHGETKAGNLGVVRDPFAGVVGFQRHE
ncbi:hypothetical protein [Tabrizicola sp.]|uniref:hypothetical protein n=1 Tax=Tabrizicola sp. TaxID=2005166 RepID=UPI00345B692E